MIFAMSVKHSENIAELIDGAVVVSGNEFTSVTIETTVEIGMNHSENSLIPYALLPFLFMIFVLISIQIKSFFF